MADSLDLHGLFEHNDTFDYEDDYEYKEDCITERSILATSIPILYSVALVLGLMGNVLVLVVLWQKRCKWSVTDCFVLHLSVADILLLLTMPLWAVDAAKGWNIGTEFCKLTGAMFKINFYCSIFLLVCISLDLYSSIVHAVQMYSRKKLWTVQLICLAVWAFCFILSIPDRMYLKAEPEDIKAEPEDTIVVCAHKYPSQASCLISRLFYHVLGFFLPAIVLLYCYAHILLRCRSDQRVQKQRAVRIILAVVLAFFISWAPYNIALLVDTSKSCKSTGHCEGHRWSTVKITAVLGFLHSCLNPLIYFGFSEKFRHWVFTIVKCGTCAVDRGFFPWDSSENDQANSATQEEKGSLHPMSDVQTITRQQNDEIL